MLSCLLLLTCHLSNTFHIHGYDLGDTAALLSTEGSQATEWKLAESSMPNLFK